ncbi:hypothetical protein I7I50_05958 [Histoplasma capsulatum G186AR]|uniref:Uncharacterized protein n=1 Tax=Ajellomyces capsulatus TaxID=5037 RepID=A0A8H8D840_AJECA|nr:hypothetical protein I7I52_04217 [Histoplasma capsulatum]QSS76487.1 hypothetical protein I7I50_05958 [Histoplasma capsulatum G186AR]
MQPMAHFFKNSPNIKGYRCNQSTQRNNSQRIPFIGDVMIQRRWTPCSGSEAMEEYSWRRG